MPSSLTVRDLMETKSVTLRPDMPVSEAVTILIEPRSAVRRSSTRRTTCSGCSRRSSASNPS